MIIACLWNLRLFSFSFLLEKVHKLLLLISHIKKLDLCRIKGINASEYFCLIKDFSPSILVFIKLIRILDLL